MPIEVRNDVNPYLIGPLAYSSGLGEFGMRQADRMQQAQLAYDQMANQQAMQANQIAAQQQAMMFNKAAEQEDAYRRAMMGEWQAQNQFGRSMVADQQNFAQQKNYADYQAQLQDRSWENRLNAEGKQKLAESNRQRDFIDKFDFATPKQRQEALAQWTASQAGLKDPRYFMPEPLAFDEDIKQNGKEVEGGWIVRKPDGSWYAIPKPKDANEISREQTARALEVEKINAQNKLEVADINRRKAIFDAREKHFDKEDTRRDQIINSLTSLYRSQTTKNVDTGETSPKYTEDEILSMAQEEAYRRVPDSRAAHQQFEQDYDEYRAAVGGDTQFGIDPEDYLPSDFDDIKDRRQQMRVREEIKKWKQQREPQVKDAMWRNGDPPGEISHPVMRPGDPKGEFTQMSQPPANGDVVDVSPEELNAYKRSSPAWYLAPRGNDDTSTREPVAGAGEYRDTANPLSPVERAQDLANGATWYQVGSPGAKEFAKKAIEEIRGKLPPGSLAPKETVQAMIAILRQAGIPDAAIQATIRQNSGS